MSISVRVGRKADNRSIITTIHCTNNKLVSNLRLFTMLHKRSDSQTILDFYQWIVLRTVCNLYFANVTVREPIIQTYAVYQEIFVVKNFRGYW